MRCLTQARLWILLAGLAVLVLIPFARADSGDPAAVGPFAGDARMGAKRTLEMRDHPIRDFLADLNLATGIRFFAHPSVADDRLTLLAYGRPLAETLTAVSSFFGFEWKREGKGPDFGYTLYQAPASIAREEKDRQARIQEAAEMIADEVALYNRLEGLPLERILERADSALKELSTNSDAEKRRSLQLEVVVCEQLKASNDWRRLANRFFQTLTHAQLIALLKGGSEEYAWPNRSPDTRDLPEDVVEELRASTAAGGSSSIPYIGQVNSARLRVMGETSDEPSIKWHFTIGKRGAGSTTTSEFSSALPSSSALPEGAGSYLHEPAGWMNDPALTGPLSFSIISPPGMHSARPTLGQALMEIAKKMRVNVIADAFHTTRITGIKVEEKPLGEALTSLARMTGHRWWKQDEFVLLRSLSFDADRRKEPPATSVARWTQRCIAGTLEIDDYAEMSALADAQIATLSRMAIRGEFPDNLQPISQAREHLRLWNALSLAQRRKARGIGLPYQELTESQKKLYAIAIRDPRTSSSYRRRNWDGGESVTESIARSKLRLELRESKMWALRKGDSISMGGNSTKEEALQQIQQSNPQVKLADIQSIVFTTAAFIYDSDRGPSVRAWATLPQRWED